MKVLFIHQYFLIPSQGGGIRSYHMAKALVKKGYQVIVITAHNQSFYEKRIIEGIEVHYLPIYYDNKLGYWRRVYAFCKFMWLASIKSLRIKNCTYCYASSSPLTVGVIALFLKKIKKLPYFFEVMDLWPEAPIQMGFIKNKLFKKFLRWIEKKIYNHAEKIIAASPGIQDGIKKIVPDKMVEMIPNFSDCSFFHPISKNINLLEKYNLKNEFVISYTGTLGIANDIPFILKLMQIAQRNYSTQFYFLIAGKGAKYDWVVSMANEYKLSNVRFLGYLNKEEIKELYSIADANLVTFLPVPILETNSPNKFFDGLAAGKLTIVNTGGWMKQLCESHQCGIYASDPEHLIKSLFPFINDKNLLNTYGMNARNLAEKEFEREIVLKRFLNLFDSSVS